MPETPETKPEVKEQPKEVRELLVWSSPSRPFKRRDTRYYINIGLVLVVIAAIALFIQEFLIIAVLLALFFYLYVSGTVEPGEMEHRITNQGITTAGHSYIWDELTDFWYSQRYGETILNIGTKARFPGRLIMIVAHLDRDKIKKMLLEYLPYREVAPTTWVDNAVEWATARMPQSLR